MAVRIGSLQRARGSPHARVLFFVVRRSGPTHREDEPWCREVVVLAQHQVRSEIARRPRVEEGRCVGTEFIEQVGELFSLDGVEERIGHVTEV